MTWQIDEPYRMERGMENIKHPCAETCSGYKQGVEDGMKEKIITFKTPKYSWKLCIGNLGAVVIEFEEGRQPNAFHRFTQYVFLGFKWERIK